MDIQNVISRFCGDIHQEVDIKDESDDGANDVYLKDGTDGSIKKEADNDENVCSDNCRPCSSGMLCKNRSDNRTSTLPVKRRFVECGGSVPFSPHNHGPTPPRRPRHQSDKKDFFSHHGSDDDSDEGDDEEEDLVPLVIPRVLQGIMETPLDDDAADSDADEDEEPTAVVTADAEGHDPADVLQSMTEKPWGLNVFDWREFLNPPIQPKSRREIFSEINVGPTTSSTEPYDIFVEIWDRQIMEHIASETNKYAQMLKDHCLRPNSRISRWYDTTADELYIYFALILTMGIVVKTRIEEYWSSTADIFCTPGLRQHMSIDRFLILNECLHFNDNEDMRGAKLGNSEARIFKIQPLLSHLNNKFQNMYTPGQNIVLDESLLMWKGCLGIGQLIPSQAENRDIKTYEICESQTGYLWRFEVHVHKESPEQQIKDPLEARTPALVMQLVRGLEHKGYTLWMDNYYQSPALARRLKSLGVDCVGTLRTDRAFVPRELRSLSTENMSQGQIAGLTSGDVDVVVWRDVDRVAMISTYHGNVQQTVHGSTKPLAVHDYIATMGGVDKKDQLLAIFPIERKRTKIWYKKLFRRLLNVSVLNSYIIHRQRPSSLSLRNFRMALIKSLLSKHHCYSPLILPAAAATQTKADISHRLSELPMGKRQRMRRACTACKKLTRMYCVGCNSTVCIGPCFVLIHS